MPGRDTPQVSFHKSSHSDGGEGCVETARLSATHLVRDSKDPDGPTLAFSSSAWTRFLDQIKQGRFELA